MSGWINLATGFPRHPKALAAGPVARHLFIVGLCWCGEYDTDGRIPGYALNSLAVDAGISTDDVGAAADRLVSESLWIRTADGWQVHDWGQWQSTSAEREARRSKNRDRQREWRERQSRATEQPGSNDVTNASRNASVRGTKSKSKSTTKKSVSQSDGPLSNDLAQVVENLTTTTSLNEKPTRTTQALNIVATRLSQRDGVVNPGGYRKTILDQPDDHLPDLERIARAHPELDPDEIADRHLAARDRTPPTHTPKCGGCGSDPHDGGIAECPNVQPAWLLDKP